MHPGISFITAFLTLALAAVPSFAQEKVPVDSAFKLKCLSNSTKFLPRGSAGAGNTEFTVEVDPAGQSVVLNGAEKHAAKIDKYEVAFGVEDKSASISRSTKNFGLVVPVRDLPAGDSRKYLYYTGKCEAG